MKPRALLMVEDVFDGRVFDARAIARLGKHLGFVAPRQSATTHARLGATLRDVEVIVSTWGMPRMDDAFLRLYPNLKAVFYAAGSVRAFITDASWSRRVRVVAAAAVNASIVADFTWAQIQLSLKQVFRCMLAARQDRSMERPHASGAYARTVGLLGLGQIGRRVAERMQHGRVRVLAHDPFALAETAAAVGARLCGLEEMLAESEVVSCHLPLLADTRRMLGARHFRAMKHGATFINTARGGVVAEDEMIAVLRERKDLLAVLDVTEQEPLPSESPLYDLPNVLLTPHIAGCRGAEELLLGEAIAEDVARYVRDEPCEGEVLPERIALMA